MSNLLLQKIVPLRVAEVEKIILKKKRPLLLARSVECNTSENICNGWYVDFPRNRHLVHEPAPQILAIGTILGE